MPCATVGDMQIGQAGLLTHVKKERLNHLYSNLVSNLLLGHSFWFVWIYRTLIERE